ncbi:MAG: hypothetical protein NUV80_06915 [Candidatus Berkelbacteria bacterium]|nr:hypothetical protein [Candidatus Berkelbacteria bacterium]MCR4308259.1 hypothetical protein [Candidatus Berkelbacteria bacterium]
MLDAFLYAIGAIAVLVIAFVHETICYYRRERDLYRELWRQSDQRMSELVADLSPEANELDLTDLNANYNPTRYN